jgi:hypothetical protein
MKKQDYYPMILALVVHPAVVRCRAGDTAGGDPAAAGAGDRRDERATEATSAASREGSRH